MGAAIALPGDGRAPPHPRLKGQASAAKARRKMRQRLCAPGPPRSATRLADKDSGLRVRRRECPRHGGFSAVTSAASGDSSPSGGHAMVDGHCVVAGSAIGEWGKTKDGKTYSFTYKPGEAKPAARAAPAAVICSVYISD